VGSMSSLSMTNSKRMGRRGELLLGSGSEAERREEEEDWIGPRSIGLDLLPVFFRIERFFGRRSSFLRRTNVPIGLFDVLIFFRFSMYHPI
jgi:hypothetical protein